MSKHSELPWKVFKTPDGRKIVGIGKEDGEGVCDAGFGIWAWDDPEGIANADLIVERVNGWDALVAKVTSLESELAEARLERDEAITNGQDRIADLGAELDQAAGFIEIHKAENARLLADNATLREACKPFATFGELLELETSGFADTDKIELSPEGSDLVFDTVEIGSFRRARLSLLGPAPSVSVGWRTIESAPKDGTEIIGLFWRQYDEGDKPTIYGPWTVAFERGAWRSSWDRSEVVEYMSDFGTDYKSPDIDPTHWMPLPAPPIPSHDGGRHGDA